MKLVKVNHVVLGLRLLPNSEGFSQAEIDELVNKRLAEGYDDVQITPVRSNFNDQGSPANLVQLYIFKKYEDETAEPAVRRGRPRKEEEVA